jgi:hypothetical protein
MTRKIWIASFDIGKKNFAFCVEEVDTDKLKSLNNVQKSLRYNRDGTPTHNFRKVLKKVCLNGRTKLLENVDLTNGCSKTKYLDPQLFINMTNLLDKYREYWDKCEVFIIEQQMSFGRRKYNTMALKLGQHCFSYFVIMYSTFKTTIEFPAYHKTQVLGARKKMSKKERKEWAVDKAIDILSNRDDNESLEKLSSKKKKDDYSDTIVQLQAFKYLLYVDQSL